MNNPSLEMGEGEKQMFKIVNWLQEVLSIFVGAPIPIAFSTQTPLYEMLNSPTFCRYSTVQTTIRIRWYV